MEEIVITIPVYATMARPPSSPLTPLEEARQQVLLDRGSTKAATPKSVSCTQTREKRDVSQSSLKKKDVSGCECSLAALGICVFLYIHLSEPDLAVSF